MSYSERDNDKERKEALDQVANGMRANRREKHENHTRKMNRLWMWLGVVILIFILLFWIFGIGTAEDIMGTTNG